MALKRKPLKAKVKKQLIKEAGSKCANPGCSAWRTHIHHIQHWQFYQSNDPAILIPVCPTCHDAIHHGTLTVTDDELYAWKAITRSDVTSFAHLFVEPSGVSKLQCGSLALESSTAGMTVFNLSENTWLRFEIYDEQDIYLDLKISDLDGNLKLKCMRNRVSTCDPSLEFFQHPGHIKITTKDVHSFVPQYFIDQLNRHEAGFFSKENVTLLELHVLSPGVVSVRGCWVEKDKAVIIHDGGISLMRPNFDAPTTLAGAEGATLKYGGQIDAELFKF